MGYLRNNSIFTFGKTDRAKTSATYREILDAMWLFNDKFERARDKFNAIGKQGRGESSQRQWPCAKTRSAHRCGEAPGSRSRAKRCGVVPD